MNLSTAIAGPSRQALTAIPRCLACAYTQRQASNFAAKKDSKSKAAKGSDQDASGPMSLRDAAARLKEARPKNLPWSAYELEIHTRPNPSQNINALRGRIFPPHQTIGKANKDIIVVFAQGKDAENAKAAGADVVGGQELAAQIQDGQVVPDKLIAHPSMMSLVNPLARLLGPKGLMPSVRRGTVTEDLAGAIRDARGGLDWIADERGVVRLCIGRLHMPPEDLRSNVKLIVDSVVDLAAGSAGQSATAVAAAAFTADSGAQSPERKKKAALTKVLLSSTQGPSYLIADAL